MMRKSVLVVTAVLGAATMTACGSSSDGGDSGDKTLVVSAAASLTGSFDKIAGDFEAKNSGVQVKTSYDGSSTLVQQIKAGNDADVFASADQANMKKLTDAGLADGTPEVFATNVLEIVVPKNNPKKVKTLADLGKAGTSVVLCAPQVPCGAASQKVEKAAGVTVKPRSEEQNVKAVLAKVQAGEADAGLVYVTDVKAAGDKVLGVPFSQSSSAVNEYPITVVKNSKNAELAKKFVEFVRSAEGKKVLTEAGFTTK